MKFAAAKNYPLKFASISYSKAYRAIQEN